MGPDGLLSRESQMTDREPAREPQTAAEAEALKQLARSLAEQGLRLHAELRRKLDPLLAVRDSDLALRLD